MLFRSKKATKPTKATKVTISASEEVTKRTKSTKTAKKEGKKREKPVIQIPDISVDDHEASQIEVGYFTNVTSLNKCTAVFC